MGDMAQFFNDFKKGVEAFGSNIALIVNSVLLTLVYLAGVGITSAVAKICGKHFLDAEHLQNPETYWVDLNLKKKDIKEYYKQF